MDSNNGDEIKYFDSQKFKKENIESVIWEPDGSKRGGLKCDVGRNWELASRLAKSGAIITLHLSPGYIETLKMEGISLEIEQKNNKFSR